jgi:hypothetical protein
VVVLTSTLAPILLCLAASWGVRPWSARHPPTRPAPGHELANSERWPAEPDSPEPVDPARFHEAVTYLCGREAPSDLMLDAAASARVDPFLIAALVRERSHCDPRRSARQGHGLLDIQPDLYLEPGAPRPPGDRRALGATALLAPEHNLRVGARMLRMWQDTHPALDAAFGGVPHRSGVAHFLWGDKVANSGGEDAVFTARRRLIARYQRVPETPHATPIGVSVVCPLEGVPRLASSGPGEDRDGGARRHRGLDIAASAGEPVRSIADGVVIFAGANMRGAPRRGPIPPSQIGRFRNRRLGAGGIYLCIRHDVVAGTRPDSVVSCYMHLYAYRVATGERVIAGETIGFVGHTGVHNSPPHLHLEVRVGDQAKNPLRYLSDLVIPPKATRTYHHVLAVHRARLRASRLMTSRHNNKI